jgi:hypothetical protein
MSFETASGNYCFEVAQFLINMGAKNGAVSAKELLPHATTLSRNLNEIATVLRDSVSKEVKDVFSRVSGAMMLNLWSNAYKEMNYFGVTVYCLANGKLEDLELPTRKLESGTRRNRDNIKIDILKTVKPLTYITQVTKLCS